MVDPNTIKEKIINAADNNNDNDKYIEMVEEETSPVNEFSTAGYLTMMFPTLFINGAADLTADMNSFGQPNWKE